MSVSVQVFEGLPNCPEYILTEDARKLTREIMELQAAVYRAGMVMKGASPWDAGRLRGAAGNFLLIGRQLLEGKCSEANIKLLLDDDMPRAAKVLGNGPLGSKILDLRARLIEALGKVRV